MRADLQPEAAESAIRKGIKTFMQAGQTRFCIGPVEWAGIEKGSFVVGSD